MKVYCTDTNTALNFFIGDATIAEAADTFFVLASYLNAVKENGQQMISLDIQHVLPCGTSIERVADLLLDNGVSGKFKNSTFDGRIISGCSVLEKELVIYGTDTVRKWKDSRTLKRVVLNEHRSLKRFMDKQEAKENAGKDGQQDGRRKI